MDKEPDVNTKQQNGHFWKNISSFHSEIVVVLFIFLFKL